MGDHLRILLGVVVHSLFGSIRAQFVYRVRLSNEEPNDTGLGVKYIVNRERCLDAKDLQLNSKGKGQIVMAFRVFRVLVKVPTGTRMWCLAWRIPSLMTLIF